MTAFIGATGLGDVPTGSIEYKTIFAVGLTLFVHHVRHEHHRDPARAEVPGGSTNERGPRRSSDGSRAATVSAARIFYVGCCSSRSAIGFVLLGALLV